jgi:hypothetical protein
MRSLLSFGIRFYYELKLRVAVEDFFSSLLSLIFSLSELLSFYDAP